MHVLPRPTIQSARPPARSLTTDQLWVFATMALAAVAILLAAFDAPEIGAVAAVLAIGTGGWSQLISKNRSERFETVGAVLVAVVALAVCLAHADFPSWF